MTTLIRSPEEVPTDALVPENAKPGSLAVYHTNQHCRHLENCEGTRPLTWDDARTTIRECNYCQSAGVPTLDGLPNDAVVSGYKSTTQLSVYHTSPECSAYPDNPRDPADAPVMGELRECWFCKQR